MGRFYQVQFNAVAITTAIDLFEIIAASGKPFVLHEIVIAQTSDFGDAQAEGLGILIKRASGSYTTGSGGTTPTPSKNLTNDAAAGATAKANNTTQAVINTGALTVIRADGWNVQAGYQYLPTPETRLLFLPAEACVVSMTVPADSLTVSGTLVFEEL